MARSMLAHSNSPTSLWGEALNNATFIYNNSSQPSINLKIPNQILFNHTSSPNKFKVFGCDAYVLIDEDKRGAFDARFKKSIFVGINTQQNCYRIYDPETRRTIQSRDVKFVETSFEMIKSINGDRNYSPDISNVQNINHPIITSIKSKSIDATIPVPSQIKPIAPAPTTSINSDTTINNTDSKVNNESGGVEENDIHFDDDNQNEEKEEKEETPTIQEMDQPSLPSPSPIPTPVNQTKEVKQLTKSSKDWNISNTTQRIVPSHKRAGTNKLTYSSDTHKGQVTETLPSVSSKGRVITPTARFRNHLIIDEDGNLYDPITTSILVDQQVLSATDVPNNYREAIKSDKSSFWLNAMKEELLSHEANGTWTEVDSIEPNHIPITARWVYVVKKDENNNPIRYKARLVARGFEQVPGVDFDETFAPVTKLKSIKLLLSLAAGKDLEIKQLDFDTAFLNARLNHKVYLRLPPGTGHEGQAVQLIKSLYGLKQAGHDWHELISGKLFH